jgi:type IV pilus assembly protein PilA
MRKLHTRQGGFTLIELMIVVAIIGILAAIAIPNFLRFQLRARSSEGKTNIAAIRTAEEGYNAEYNVYVIAADEGNVAGPGNQKAVWPAPVPNAPTGFDTIGWSPEGEVYFTYNVQTGNAAGVPVYTAEAAADIDNDGTAQTWGYVHAAVGAAAGIPGVGPTVGAAVGVVCSANGVFDPQTQTMILLNTTGPCDATSGQSVF